MRSALALVVVLAGLASCGGQVAATSGSRHAGDILVHVEREWIVHLNAVAGVDRLS